MTDASPSIQTVVITGASGLIGSALTHSLEIQGYRILRAVRRNVSNPECEIRWDPEENSIDEAKLAGADIVIHLAGENIAGGRWNDVRKQRILQSRTAGTRLISTTLARMQRKPRVLACASAIGFYGVRDEQPLDEDSTPGSGFLADLCQQWEAECQPALDAGIRVVNLRTGVVLTPEGGALAKMLLPFKLGLGGKIGSGKQYFSWIALDDAVRAIAHTLKDDSLRGPINLTAPNPVTNDEFTKTLGRVLHRPTIFPMPSVVARLLFGRELADEMLLGGARILPKKLTAARFPFYYPHLTQALEHLLANQ